MSVVVALLIDQFIQMQIPTANDFTAKSHLNHDLLFNYGAKVGLKKTIRHRSAVNGQ